MLDGRASVVNLEELKDFIKADEYIIIVDSCVFLDYYRYSSQTAKAILKNLEHLKNYLWIPNQVYKEFKKNNNLVLQPNHNKYKNITTNVSSFTKKFENSFDDLIREYNKFNFPKVNELRGKILEHLKSIENEAEQYKKDIKKEMEDMALLLRSNDMLTFIEDLKEGNQVGKALSSFKLLEIVEEGQRRFKFNLPPGYEDEGKDTSSKEAINKKDDPLAPYGDLIIWKSLIEKARTEKVNVIFTTSDSKSDWWHLSEDKTEIIAPREELLAEFFEQTNGKSKVLMIPMREFVSKFSIINGISALHLNIELNAEDILKDQLFESGEQIQDFLISEAYHVHLGNIEDIEDFEIVNVGVDNIEIEFEDELATVTADFQIECSGYLIEYINRDYSEATLVTIKLKGRYSIEIELDFEKDEYTIADYRIDKLSLSQSKVHYADDYEDESYINADWSWKDFLDVCNVCNNNIGDNNLFPERKICDACSQDSSKFFLCTSCSTFYRHEEYNGDGEKCIKCLEL
ncbi:PIN-like domain-containing protein [Lysinibacillus sp. M3]|uniref:PIN-like domain-containing protein n=1 Tax=Lysinibacillus zambalensis TaxID=3160866 RepID=A0ABV1MZW4_9BACI